MRICFYLIFSKKANSPVITDLEELIVGLSVRGQKDILNE